METKVCIKCPERGPQPIENFAKKTTTRYQSWCKECHRAYNKSDYNRRIDFHKNRVRDRRNSIKEWMKSLKSTLNCSRCVESHPACLQFHHRDPSIKSFTLANAHRHGWSIKKLEEEIVKCDVLCANCHAKEHWSKLPS